MNSIQRNQEVGKLKRKVTRALGRKLDPNRAISKFQRADERGRNGFKYSDEAGENSYYPKNPKGDVQRVGVIVSYSDVLLWGAGRYDEAFQVHRAMNFYMAYVLAEQGFKVSVTGNGQGVTIWADENERV